MNNGRLTKYVRKKQMMFRQKEDILHHGFFFRFPHILIINDDVGWFLNANSIDRLILVKNKCGV